MRTFTLLVLCLSGLAFAGEKKRDIKKPDAPDASEVANKKSLTHVKTTDSSVPSKDTITAEKK